jgi:hypothetical protein
MAAPLKHGAALLFFIHIPKGLVYQIVKLV